MPTLVVW